MRYTIFTIVFFLLNASVSVGSDLTPKDIARAKTYFKEGAAFYSRGNYDEAAASFRAAFEIKPALLLQFNMGQSYAAGKRYGLALDAFEGYLARGGDDVPMERMNEVVEEMRRLRMLVGILEVKAPNGLTLFVDGIPRGTTPLDGIVRVAVGERRVLLKKDNAVVHDSKIRIVGEMTTVVEVESQGGAANAGHLQEQPSNTGVATMPMTEPEGPAEPSVEPLAPEEQTIESVSVSDENVASESGKPLLVAGIISAVVSGGGIGMGIAFSAKFSSDKDKRDTAADQWNATLSPQAKTQAEKFDDEMGSAKVGLITGYIIGGVALGTAIVLFTKYKKKKSSAAARVNPAEGLVVNF